MWIHPTGAGNQFHGAPQTEGAMSAREGDRGSGPEEERSLAAHRAGPELWILRLEESVLLGHAAGDDDGLAGELAHIGG
jgi:hypothetical protein